jgi:hypothetical protein
MKLLKKKGITSGRINRLLGVLLAISLAVGAGLHWQGSIREAGLVLLIIVALIVGILFPFGVRMAQRDGFLDGYARAKDHFDREGKF